MSPSSATRRRTTSSASTPNIARTSSRFPTTPTPTTGSRPPSYYSSYGLRDGQTERDSFVIANWVHTLSPKALFAVAPFYHFNQANYDSPATDIPVATTWHQTSNYAGGQADAHADVGPNSFSAGLYSFYPGRERSLRPARQRPGFSAPPCPTRRPTPTPASSSSISPTTSRLGRYVTLLGGKRFSIYHAGLNESAIYPRIGATVEIPRLHWVLRGFYGHFFQPAPVETVSSALLNYATSQHGRKRLRPLPSERDEEHQFGIQIP